MSHKFWSDDFDMDLLKVIPDTPKLLGALADRSVWTVGHETDGRLNHPCVWNTHGAYVWRDKPNLERDKHGWFRVNGCVSDSPEIECTVLELLRDQWAHHYGFIILPSTTFVPSGDWSLFERIMYHIRTWKPSPDIDADLRAATYWLMDAARRIETGLR